MYGRVGFTSFLSTVDDNGSVVIPGELSNKFNIKPNEHLEFMSAYDDEIIIVRKYKKLKATFTTAQLIELKRIIEDSGSNDAIEFIDEIVKPQNLENYIEGRVIK